MEGPSQPHERLSLPLTGIRCCAPARHCTHAKKGLRPGGFGIATMRAMVDELIYNEAQNEVVFVKYLD